MQVTTVDDILGPSEGDRLKLIADENTWLDKDLLMDVYLVVKTGGTNFVPDSELLENLERTDPAYWTHRIDIGKRKEYLEALASSKYMQALLALGDAFKAVSIFVDHMKKAFAAKLEAAKKRGSIDHASGGSPEGYADEQMLDAVAQKRADASLSFDDYMDGVTSYQEICEDDAVASFISGCGNSRLYDSTNVGPGRALASAVVQYGANLPQAYPVLFDWYTKILDKLGVKKLKDVDATDSTEKHKNDQMEDYDKMDQIDPSDVEREDFDAKVAAKSLDVRYDLEQEEGTCHLIVLLDTSGSMMCSDLGGRVCRAFAANVLTLALLNFALKSQYTVHVVPFAGDVARHRVQHASDRESALTAMRWLGGQEYDGGGTDISAALLYAYGIVQKDPAYQKCDIVLISDGCSDIAKEVVTDKPAKTKIRTLVCAPSRGLSYGAHFDRLKKVSDSFALLDWDNNTNGFSVGNALDGINDPHSNDA